MKLEKRTIGLILITVMFLSTFAYSMVERFWYFRKSNNEESLLVERILSHITENQRILAISNGFTIIYFNYSSPYDEVKSYLESLTSNHYVYLVESLSNQRFLKIESLRGSREINNPDLNQTIDILCQIMVDRPVDCVMREIK
jgi:hypothetical protein